MATTKANGVAGKNGNSKVERITIPAPTVEGLLGENHISIAAPKVITATYRLTGNAPLVVNKFSAKAREQIRRTQEAGPQAKKGKIREPKDFQLCYNQARHISTEGWDGIAAPAFRNAMIDACRMVGFKMTHAKCSVFVVADGIDADEGTPLVRIHGEPRYAEHCVRNDSGVVDIRARPLYATWEVHLNVRFNADQFTTSDVGHLLMHAGISIGVGEGRPFSKNSAGQGWGTFDVTF
jgi:hypothetical protein